MSQPASQPARQDALEAFPQSIDAAIGRALRSRRRELDLTLQQLSLRVGIGFQQIQKYERGVHRVSAAALVRLAHALDVDVGYFFHDLQRRPH